MLVQNEAMGLPLRAMSLGEFLEWENAQPDRNEFHRGEVLAMVGARRVHERVAANLVRRIGNALDGSPCQVFSAGAKLQVADEAILYPDVFVTCDRTDLATEMIFRSPSVVIEVPSPATAAYDQGLKFSLYRRVASLREFVLIDPDTRRVESFRRGDDGLWVLHDMTDAAALALPTIDVVVPMAELFAGVQPPA